MAPQHHAQPQFLTDLQGPRMNRMLVVAMASERIAHHVRDTASHARPKIHSRRPKNDDHACGHVLTAMLADALDHRQSPAIPHCETFARPARNVQLARRRTIKYSVADQHVTAK